MRIAALADLHLGFRAFHARAEGTRRNLREVDVEQTWGRVVEQVLAEGVDLVTIAGDLFHHPRVSDYAKRAFLNGVGRLAQVSPVIVLQGNHDAGKSGEVLTPVALAEALVGTHYPVHVVTDVQRVRVGRDLSVTCIPYVDQSEGRTYRLRPNGEAIYNVLLAHAAVRSSADGAGKLPYFYGGDGTALDVGKQADLWDAILLGDYHEFTRLHPTRPVIYSGSIDRTSSNIWQEEASKGWALVDIDTGSVEFREVATRPMWNEVISAPFADDVNHAVEEIAYQAEQVDGERPMVRLRVDDFDRAEKRLIDWGQVNALKKMVAHFYLDLRYRPLEIADLGERRDAGEKVTLASEAKAYFADAPEAVRDLVFEELGVTAEVRRLG